MRPLLVATALCVAAPLASAGTVVVDRSAPFDSAALTRAIAVRAAGGARCAAIDVRVVRPGVVRVACDGRAGVLGIDGASGDDAARAVALTILSLAEPGIPVAPWTPRVSAARRRGEEEGAASWHLGLAGGGLFGAGELDRSSPFGRAQLERRSGWWGAGAAVDLSHRESADVIPAMRTIAATLWLTGEIAGVELGPVASAGVVELSRTTRGRFLVAAVGARVARRFDLTRSMALGLFGEPTVAIQRVEVVASGTREQLASTPRLGLLAGLELVVRVAP